MRLTQKADKEHEHLKMCLGWLELSTKDYYVRVINETPTQMYQKLGQLEDIEDELGIDLITLFKALKNGIYVKIGHSIKQARVECIDIKHKTITYIKNDGVEEWDNFIGYGKTWALTEEELL